MTQAAPAQAQINIELPGDLEATYTNFAIINHSPSEIVIDFYDQLKSRTQGYASLDYTLAGYQASDLVKLDILVNGTPVDALSLTISSKSPKLCASNPSSAEPIWAAAL